MTASTLEAAAADCSALVFARDEGNAGGRLPLVVALHARGGDCASEVRRVRQLFGPAPDVVALQAARPCNPMQSNYRGAAAYCGFSWYLGSDPSRPEAASFGDALAQVELSIDALSRPFLLAGDEQGGVLALALSLFAPDGLVAVHAARAAVATIDGWQPPFQRLDGIAVMLDGPEDASRVHACGALAARGAAVVDGATGPSPSDWLLAISSRHRETRCA